MNQSKSKEKNKDPTDELRDIIFPKKFEDPIKELKNIVLLKELKEPYFLLKPLELIMEIYDEESNIEVYHIFPAPKENINRVIPYNNLEIRASGETLKTAIDNFKNRLINQYEHSKKNKKDLGSPTKAQLKYLETIITKKEENKK